MQKRNRYAPKKNQKIKDKFKYVSVWLPQNLFTSLTLDATMHSLSLGDYLALYFRNNLKNYLFVSDRVKHDLESSALLNDKLRDEIESLTYSTLSVGISLNDLVLILVDSGYDVDEISNEIVRIVRSKFLRFENNRFYYKYYSNVAQKNKFSKIKGEKPSRKKKEPISKIKKLTRE